MATTFDFDKAVAVARRGYAETGTPYGAMNAILDNYAIYHSLRSLGAKGKDAIEAAVDLAVNTKSETEMPNIKAPTDQDYGDEHPADRCEYLSRHVMDTCLCSHSHLAILALGYVAKHALCGAEGDEPSRRAAAVVAALLTEDDRVLKTALELRRAKDGPLNAAFPDIFTSKLEPKDSITPPFTEDGV